MNESGSDTREPWIDEDDAPEWSDEVFERAELRRNGVVVREATGTLTRAGRPKLERPKRQVTLRLDGEVLDHFRGGGPGWQSRINATLRKAMEAG